MDPVSGPRDLPELRLWLLDQWNGPFALHAVDSYLTAGHEPGYAHFDALGELQHLHQAELWWITSEMSTLIRHASESLPPTTLTEELIPKNKVVFAFFEEPLIGEDALVEGNQMRVRALLWYHCKVVVDPEHDYVTVSMYIDSPEDLVDFIPYVPVGRTDWRYGSDTEAPTVRPAPTDTAGFQLASMAQDRRWLAALTLLASEPLAERRTVKLTNKARLRSYRKKTKLPSDVRLVGLRMAPQKSDGDGESRKVNWSHRWIVGAETGGFWKQQAFGPGWSLHRPRWIMPFEKGPKDKPLVVKDTVHVLRTQRQGVEDD